MGVVHHTHYLIWFEVGRTELMRERGRTYADMERSGTFMPVVEATCRYRAPSRYDEEIEVETVVSAASRVRVEFSYRVTRPSDGTLLATGRTLHAATDSQGLPRRMPREILEDLGAHAAKPASGSRSG
jgi:acyl-CoA thioester hydrolase